MAKKVAPVVSGAGQFLDFMIHLAAAVKCAGGDLAERVEQMVGAGGDRATFNKIAELIVGVKEAVTNGFVLTIDPAKPIVYDKTKDGWTKVSDVEYRPGEVELELCEFLKPGETSVNGEEMVRRAIKMSADYGQKHAEAFLAKYERWAPPEGIYYIAFPGTVWRGSSGGRSVPYLGWRGGRWCLSFGWLRLGWLDDDRLLRARK